MNQFDPNSLADNLADLINKAIQKASQKIDPGLPKSQPSQRKVSGEGKYQNIEEEEDPEKQNFSNQNFRRAVEYNNRSYNDFNPYTPNLGGTSEFINTNQTAPNLA